MINLVCGDPKTKIWKANVLFKYDYKLWKIENMVVPVGTTGVNGLIMKETDSIWSVIGLNYVINNE